MDIVFTTFPRRHLHISGLLLSLCHGMFAVTITLQRPLKSIAFGRKLHSVSVLFLLEQLTELFSCCCMGTCTHIVFQLIFLAGDLLLPWLIRCNFTVCYICHDFQCSVYCDMTAESWNIEMNKCGHC